MANKESVVIKDYGPLAPQQLDPPAWPSGEFLMETLRDKGLHPELKGDATYWQAAARWVLLQKYGFKDRIPSKEQAYHQESVQGKSSRRLVFTAKELEVIQQIWDSLGIPDTDKTTNDLLQLLQSGRSNNRTLQWAVMDVAAGCQFHLHAHPNLELVYCAAGALHEIRMEGDPLTKDYQVRADNPAKLKGPNLTQLSRPWYFDSLQEGEWLVNEAGSIHKSFTATSGDGCLLLVLWGGSHADVLEQEEPASVNVQKAVDTMDDKLGNCDCTTWDRISETFLPESEKRAPNASDSIDNSSRVYFS